MDMSTTAEQYRNAPAVADLAVSARSRFITLTYLHLFGAVMAFTGLLFALFATGAALPIAQAVGGNPLLMVGAFVLVGWGGAHVANRTDSLPLQYAALAAFVTLYAVAFLPLLAYAFVMVPGAISSAATVTVIGFAGLTAVVFTTRKDFSFLGAVVRWGFICALVLIVGSILFGFHLGTFFSVAMVALAGAAVLYDTSNVLHHYPQTRYVGAALALFASVAILFIYILRLFVSSRD